MPKDKKSPRNRAQLAAIARLKDEDLSSFENLPVYPLATYAIGRDEDVVDADGVGAGGLHHLEGVKGFAGGSSPMQDVQREREAQQPGHRVNNQNLRAQCYHTLAQ